MIRYRSNAGVNVYFCMCERKNLIDDDYEKWWNKVRKFYFQYMQAE